jgi:hypothetical protein
MAGAPNGSQRPRLFNTEYTIGWICAIRPEHVAARCFLDEEPEGLDSRSPGDSNSYTLGRCGVHNVFVVLRLFGEYGTSSATAIAKDLLHSFPNVRVGLMVGIVAARRAGSMMSGSETSWSVLRGPGTVVCFSMTIARPYKVSLFVSQYSWTGRRHCWRPLCVLCRALLNR